MSGIILPRKLDSQPDSYFEIDTRIPLTQGLASAFVLDGKYKVYDRVSRTPYIVNNVGEVAADIPGRVLRFTGTSYVNVGSQSLGGVNLFASPDNRWSVVIKVRLETASHSGTYLARAGSSQPLRTFHIYRDMISTQTPAVWLRGANNELNWGWVDALWHQITITWDGSVAKAYGDFDKDKTLSVGTAAEETENIVIGARTGGAGFLLSGRMAYCHFFNRAITKPEHLEILRNPWQIFKSPTKRIPILSQGAGGPTYFDTDFAYSGNSELLGERSNVFNFYYNFTGLGEIGLDNSVVTSQPFNSDGLTLIGIDPVSSHNSEIESIGSSVSDIESNLILSSDLETNGIGSADLKNNTTHNTNIEASGDSSADFTDTLVKNSDISSNGTSSVNSEVSSVIGTNFDYQGLSQVSIENAYVKLCEIVANGSSTQEIISSVIQSTEINSVGSCIFTIEEGADGGSTVISVDLIISGSSSTLPKVQKVIPSNFGFFGYSHGTIRDQITKSSDLSLTGTSSETINTQKVFSSDLSAYGESQVSIVNNIVINARVNSDGVAESTIDSISIQNTDIESVGSTVINFLDNFIKSSDFLSNGTCVISFQEGSDGGTIIINVEFAMGGTSTINNNVGTVLNADIQSHSVSDFISNFTSIYGQDFSADGSSIVNFIREYLILQTNRKFISVAEKRNYTSIAERRNYTSRAKEND